KYVVRNHLLLQGLKRGLDRHCHYWFFSFENLFLEASQRRCLNGGNVIDWRYLAASIKTMTTSTGNDQNCIIWN
ncbi:MAG: hypothetical protein VW352_10995, partial [Gammaproteobacteria bacterium]